MSVWAMIAAAKQGSDIEKSLARGLEDYLNQQLAEQEYYRKLATQQELQQQTLKQQFENQKKLEAMRQAFQQGLERMRISASENELFQRTFLDVVSKASESGIVDPETAAVLSNLVFKTKDPKKLVVVTTSILGPGFANKQRTSEFVALAKAFPNASPDNLAEAYRLASQGNTAEAAKVLGVSNAEFTEKYNKIRLRKGEAEASIAEATAKFTPDMLAADLASKRAGIELTETQTKELKQKIQFDLEEHQYRIPILASNAELAKEQVKLAKQKYQIGIVDLNLRQAELDGKIFENYVSKEEFKHKKKQWEREDWQWRMDAQAAANETVKGFAMSDPELAKKWVKEHAEDLKKVGINPDTLIKYADDVHEMYKYTLPRYLEAKWRIEKAMQAPPDPNEEQKVLESLRKDLKWAGVDDQTADTYLNIVRGTWNKLRKTQDLDARRVALQEAALELNRQEFEWRKKVDTATLALKREQLNGTGKPDYTGTVKVLNLRRQKIDSMRQVIKDKMIASGCYTQSITGATIAVVYDPSVKGTEYCNKVRESLEGEYNDLLKQLEEIDSWIMQLMGVQPANQGASTQPQSPSVNSLDVTNQPGAAPQGAALPPRLMTAAEQVKGKALAQNGPLDQAEALRILRQVSPGFTEADYQGALELLKGLGWVK